MFSNKLSLYIFVIFLVASMTASDFISEGMFLDGLFYADVARNIAEGKGSFWTPIQSVDNSIFYGHPPLGVGLQSILFKLLGDNIYVERIYGLITYIITGWLIVRVWKTYSGNSNFGWLPLLLWLSVAKVTWSLSNNMLENTMTMFTTAALLCYLYSLKENSVIWILLSGCSLSLAFLTKGVFSLYLWSLPLVFWFVKREKNLIQALVQTAGLIIATIAPLILLALWSYEIQDNITNYFNTQVLTSIRSEQNVGSRFQIIIYFLQGIIVPVVISLAVFILGRFVNKSQTLSSLKAKESLTLFIIVLTGVIPIMVSMKQSSFYILSVYPILAVALANLIHGALQNFKFNSNTIVGFKVISGLLIVTTFYIGMNSYKKILRDKDLMSDMHKIIDTIQRNTSIETSNVDLNIKYYLARYGQIQTDNTINSETKYYLTCKNCEAKSTKYSPIDLGLKNYSIYRND